MSQPQDFGPHGSDPLAVLIKNFDQLTQVFHATEKNTHDRMMGIEFEMFAEDLLHAHPLAYEGAISISKLFFHLALKSAASHDPYVPVIEEGNIVALNSKRATIALEPGGQLEIAAKPQKTLLNVNQIFQEVAKDLDDAARDLGIELFAIGIHPLAGRHDMATVKKSRYDIMRSYMGHLPGLGLDMMTRSCSIQVNLDFQNEADMVAKTQLAARLIPFFSLLCSSAAFIEGKATSHALPRGHIWRETDTARTGIPSVIFAPNFGYRAWTEWVLDVPMYFIRRGTTYINVAGASFRDFMAHGLKGEQATVRDFVDHLSTVFTEIRLKPFLELRSPDSLPVAYVQALSALSWALFYRETSFQKARSMLGSLGHEELVRLHHEVIDNGSKAQWRGKPVLEVAGALVAIAKDELKTMPAPTALQNCADYLKPFEELVKNNCTVADSLRRDFSVINDKNLLTLIKKMDIIER